MDPLDEASASGSGSVRSGSTAAESAGSPALFMVSPERRSGRSVLGRLWIWVRGRALVSREGRAARRVPSAAPGSVAYDLQRRHAQRLRRLRWLVLFLVVVASGVVALWSSGLSQRLAALEARGSGAGAWAAAPTGFAEACTRAWVSAGGGDEEAAGFLDQCVVGLSGEDLGDQSQGMLAASAVTAWPEARYTYRLPSVDDEHLLFSVFVSVDLRAFEQRQSPGDPVVFGSRGVIYTRATYSVDVESGRVSMVGLPGQVSASPDAEPPVSAVELERADRTDPRTRQVSEFLRAYYLEPETEGDGELGRFLVPGFSVVPLHSPEIVDVAVARTWYGDSKGGEVEALVAVELTFEGGAVLTENRSLRLVLDGELYRIADASGGMTVFGSGR